MYTYYLFLMGLEIILIYLYLRLFIPRYCYTLDYLRLHHNYFHIFIYINFILIHLTVILIIVYTLYKKYYNYGYKSSWFFLVTQIINQIYWQPLIFLHDTIAPHIPYSGKFMLHYSTFAKYVHNKKESYAIINSIAVFFVFFPKIFVTLLFVIEMFKYNRIHYFIYCLPILLLPSIYKIFLKLCESFSERSFLIIEEDLIIIIPEKQPEKGILPTFGFKLKKEVFALYGKDTDYDKYLDDLISDWFEFYRLKLITNTCKVLINTYEPLISLLCSLLYLIAGIYKLWFVFF